ncbi:DUF6522 family protein [Salinarimonas sp.]|uniref:DUF6522 family protein n=1 Tax=Salinarimonas sp. TaxID=2766526 RepID=UPI00391CEFA1
MSDRVERDSDGFHVDAKTIGEGFGIEPAEVVRHLREGTITSLVERGENEDEGLWRLTFFHASARYRLIVDETGAILKRSRIAYDGVPLPAALRRRGS